MKKIIMVAILSASLAGCAKWNSTGISYIPPTNARGNELLEYSDGSKPNAQRVILWDSKYSAGISTKDGTCAQGALSVKSGSLSLSADTIGEIAKPEVNASTSALLVNATNGQTSFANISFFYLCQISLNNEDLTGDQIVKMWLASNATAQKISADAAGNQSIDSDDTIEDSDGNINNSNNTNTNPGDTNQTEAAEG